jgi:hypothetical protein
MDPHICTYPFTSSGDLNLCHKQGIAYQPDTSDSVEYDKAYYDKYVAYENTEISKRLNAFRVGFTSRCRTILDIGIGSGEFIRSSPVETLGYDVNPIAVEWLRNRGLYLNPYKSLPSRVSGITLWDTLEHIPTPTDLLNRLPIGIQVFVSIPIFETLSSIKDSKHYRPNEHFYYFTHPGLLTYFDDLGYTLIEHSDGESRAGRESIGSFHFRKRR